ncbi:MAG: recombination protein RecR [Candidatus Ryanbacteria bacterium]|nr:recombination protein RecR [Candidatus Ryanbacteria bacterium]
MHPEPIKRLIDFFTRLPGIGPRQASRFAYTLLDEDQSTLKGFARALEALADQVSRCEECFRGVETADGKKCSTCKLGAFNALLIVEKDQDFETVSKSGLWDGGYHVLGGTISLLNEKTRVTERIRALYDRIGARAKGRETPLEIVLATSLTTEGDATGLYIERVLEPYIKNKSIALTRLGRGISTGTEMEFADPQTLKNALKNRK